MDKLGKIYTVLESSDKAVPKSLESVIKHLQKSFESPTTNQLLIGVMYTLLLECGYSLASSSEDINYEKQNISHDKDKTINVDDMPTLDTKKVQSLSTAFSYKQVLSQTNLLFLNSVGACCDVFKLTFHLIGLPDYTFTLIMTSRRGLAVVNLVVNLNELIGECYSVAFSPSSFVQMSNDDESIASKFHDLKNFSILFKDNIALKGRSYVLNSLLIANNSLEGLPEEIFLKIMKLLHINDILNVAITCTRLFSGVRQCSLWIFLLKRDFSLTIDYEGVEELILKYREEKIKRKPNSRNVMVDIDEMFEDAISLHETRNALNNSEIYYLSKNEPFF